jgi:hypothetical protein
VTPRKQNFLSDTSPSLFEADGANHVGRIKSGILPSKLRRSVGGGANRRNVVTAGSKDVPKQISSIATEGNRNSDSNSDSVGIGNRGHNKRKIIISNGLLHQGKGMEYAIQVGGICGWHTLSFFLCVFISNPYPLLVGHACSPARVS